MLLFPKMSRQAWGPTQPHTQWVPGALSLAVKWARHGVNHLPPSTAKVKNERSYTSAPICYVFMV
jgi:hypothetical protein